MTKMFGTPSDPSSCRLLVVDDDSAQRHALTRTLEEQGYASVGVDGPPAALAALRDAKFDLMLTDLTMPGMDGIALLRAALALDSDLVGIIMTGQGSIGSAVEAMKEGALDYILKPFKASVLLPVIARALTMRRLRLENAALVRRVRERTEALEAANESLDAFASSVAHDLHAPARHIASFADMILEQHGAELSPEVTRHVRTIAAAGQRMGTLIDDVLLFSRIARADLKLRPVDLTGLAQRVWNELEVLRQIFVQPADTRTIEWRPADLPTVAGDEAMLRQVFYNLFSNALKYTRRRNPTVVEVGCEERRPDGSVVVFVRDNGVGFDLQHAPKLFGLFQRFHSEREFEGNGVGLANVQRIVQRHGGRVWAESEVDKGATFYFQLPGAPPTVPSAGR